jgi:3-oxo-5-alpha-steroid 4-dehydrogenase 3
MEKFAAEVTVLKEYAQSQPPSQWFQLLFLTAAGGVIALQALPRSIRSAFMDYGPRREAKAKPEPEPNTGVVVSLTRQIASVGQVPHSWFWHFYFVSVSWSAFWAWQFATKGRVMGALAEWEVTTADSSSSSPVSQRVAGEEKKELGRVFVAWLLLMLQGLRRLVECLVTTKAGSRSPMWIVHWGLGLAFYTIMGASIWIQGSGK